MKIHALIDEHGLPVKIVITPDNNRSNNKTHRPAGRLIANRGSPL
jgi:transposase